MILVADARRLGWNEAGTVTLLYRGPHATKLYRLRVSDQGLSPTLLGTAHDPESGRALALERCAERAAGTLEIRRDGHVRLLPGGSRA